MALSYWDIEKQIDEARDTITQGDRCVCMTAKFASERLRSAGVDVTTLKQLKSELTKFNSHTGEWKD